jgi:hypothetical protein
MIGISAQIYDTAGARVLETAPEKDLANRKGSRRVTLTATLDGGMAVYDSGFADGDRIVTVEVPDASQVEIDFAEYICRTYNLITLTAPDGAYDAVPESYNVDTGTLKMTLRITQKLSGI